jgi:glycosyltransferase involved in cell wall biosynthesis
MVGGFEDGGVERNFSHLAMGLGALGVETDLLVGGPDQSPKQDHPYLRGLGPRVAIRRMTAERTTALAGYLNEARPDILLTGKLADDLTALAVLEQLRGPGAERGRAPIPTRLIAAVGTPLSGRFAERPWYLLKRWRETRRIRACYNRLDGLTAISEGVAADLRQTFGVRGTPIAVLNNPIVPPDLRGRAAAPCPHPWLAQVTPGTPAGERPPVLIAVGGLRKVKDFETLLRAFARLDIAGAHLLVLGEGKERRGLERQASRLGIDGRVDLSGFVPDPYPYLARARLLVLSSRREGLGNVVVEALAVGTPVVATDCSQGLRVLQAQGALEPLVPIGRPAELARGIADALGRDPDPGRLACVVQPFGLIAAARAHLAFFESLTTPR